MTPQNVANGLIRNGVPQVGQRADDAVVTRAGSFERRTRFRRQILILQEQFLVRRTGHVSQQPKPFAVLHSLSILLSCRRFEFLDPMRWLPGANSKAEIPSMLLAHVSFWALPKN